MNAIRLFQDEGFYVAVSFVPDKALVSDRTEIFKVIEFFKDLGINDMRLTSPILSGKLTARPEEKLTPENVKTFGNIHERPITEIWAETSKNFCKPGCSCYANLSNDYIFVKKPEEWPLMKQAIIEILAECPSYDESRSPEFYRRMGCPADNAL